MKTEWHRPNEITVIATPPATERRPFLYPTPVLREDMSHYLDYPQTQELGVSLYVAKLAKSLPFGNVGLRERPTHYPELLVKQAVWFVKHLCKHTDMAEMGVPIRLGLTTDLREVATPYLEACQFPMHAVDWFESRTEAVRYSPEFDAMRQPAFGSVERVLHLDLCFLIGTHSTQRQLPLFSRILEQWIDQPMAVNEPLLWDRTDPHDTHPIEGWHSHLEAPIWQFMADDRGTTPKKEHTYWLHANPIPLVKAGMFGFARALRSDPAFWEWFDKLTFVSTNDEVALAALSYLRDWTDSDVACLHPAFNWQGPPFRTVPYVTRQFCYCNRSMPTDIWLSQHSE